jgi:hypothetical protein
VNLGKTTSDDDGEEVQVLLSGVILTTLSLLFALCALALAAVGKLGHPRGVAALLAATLLVGLLLLGE